jgi:hypothetical protein
VPAISGKEVLPKGICPLEFIRGSGNEPVVICKAYKTDIFGFAGNLNRPPPPTTLSLLVELLGNFV